MLKDTTEN